MLLLFVTGSHSISLAVLKFALSAGLASHPQRSTCLCVMGLKASATMTCLRGETITERKGYVAFPVV